jgi:hypothetical protein
VFFVLSLATPLVVLAEELPASNHNDAVTATETKAALLDMPGILGGSDQVVTKSDADSAIVTTNGDTSVDVPKDPEQGVTFGAADGPKLEVALPNADQAGNAKQVAPGVVAYDSGNGSANAVQANEDGSVRMLTIIDNPSAPTEYRYVFDVANGSLTFSEDGGVFALDEEGQIVGALESPWAKDANGEALPTWYTVDGLVLTQYVDHGGPGVAYPVVADPTYLGYSMNDAEFSWCRWPSRWSLCISANSLAGQALAAAQKVEKQYGWSIHNGGADAYRHCYWSGLMAQKMGVETAKGFGDRHEESTGQPQKERDMDLYNNAKGRSWASTGSGLHGRCITGVQKGELKRMVN